MKQFGRTETKLFHFYMIFKHGGGGGGGQGAGFKRQTFRIYTIPMQYWIFFALHSSKFVSYKPATFSVVKKYFSIRVESSVDPN